MKTANRVETAFNTPARTVFSHESHILQAEDVEGSEDVHLPETLETKGAAARNSEQNKAALGALQISMSEHRICMVVPAGAKMDCQSIDLPGGILILGALRGHVVCATGSVVIARSGEFQGSIKADDVIVEGKITSPLGGNGKPIAASISMVEAHGQINEEGQVTGGIVAFSASAFVCAKFKAVSYYVPQRADLNRSILETFEPRQPSKNQD